MLLYAHSGVRYLVLLAGVVALVYALFGAVTKRPYDRTMLSMASAFAGLTHLQVLLGVALLVTGQFYSALIGHIVCMVFAAVVAQLVPSVMRRRAPGERSFLPHTVGILVALGLMVAGIMAIGRGPLDSTMGG